MVSQAFPFAVGADEAHPPMAEMARLAAQQVADERRFKPIVASGWHRRELGETRSVVSSHDARQGRTSITRPAPQGPAMRDRCHAGPGATARPGTLGPRRPA